MFGTCVEVVNFSLDKMASYVYSQGGGAKARIPEWIQRGGGGLFTTAPDFVLPLKRRTDEDSEKAPHKKKKRRHEDQIGGGDSNFNCPVCGKGYARKWTLERHLQTHKDEENGPESDEEENEDEAESRDDGNESDDEESDENGDEEEENIDSESDEENEDEEEEDDSSSEKSDSDEDEEEGDDEENISSKTIDCLLHMIGAAELGKLDLNTDALRVFITDKKCDKNEDEDEQDEPQHIGSVAVRFLKELMVAAKDEEIRLSKSLYSDILNAIDKAGDSDED